MLITVLLAAFAATAAVVFVKSLMEKKAKLNAQLFWVHIRWRSRLAKGMFSADPECTQHSSIPKSELLF